MTTKNDRTIIGFLGDESGSMMHNQQAMVDGFNEFVGNIRAGAGEKDVSVMLGFFDLSHQPDILRIKIDAPLKECREITGDDYRPHGSTPLNDATLQMIRNIDKRAEDGDKVMLVIFTDGLENASESSTDDVRKLIADKEKRGWEFIYLGANQDAWGEGSRRGIAANRSYNTTASPKGVTSTMRSVSALATSRVNLDDAAYKQLADERHEALAGKIDEEE